MALSRRQLLQFSAGSLALAMGRRATAIGSGSKFRFGQLALGDGRQPRPSALPRLAREVDKRTSIDIDLAPRVVRLGAGLHETPFLYLAGDREFPIPEPSQIDRLRRFLTFGGFLFIDSAEGTTGGAFHGSVRQLVDAIYPDRNPLSIVPKDHVVYKSFYLLDRPYGRLSLSSAMEGVELNGRLVLAYAQNDLGGAWARDDFGNWEFACEPGGERQRELSFRMGVNLVMYALCLDYKADQVHVETIMRRRPWRPDDGAEVPSP